MTEYILLGIFAILLGHYSLFLFSILIGLRKLKPSQTNQIPKEFVSIIIPFRNESENIISNIKSIIKQNFPIENYEVIYVDDSSTDNSFRILNEFPKPKNVKVLSLPGDYSPNAHKKRAIRYGIENSAGEIIITTDADCVVKPLWVKTIASFYQDDVGMVDSYTTQLANNSFGGMQAIDFIYLLLVGGGTINLGIPISCIGNNMSFRKKAYDEIGGYEALPFSVTEDFTLLRAIYKLKKYKILLREFLYVSSQLYQ